MNSRTTGGDRSERVLRWIAAALAIMIFVLAAACREDDALARRGDISAEAMTVAAAPALPQAPSAHTASLPPPPATSPPPGTTPTGTALYEYAPAMPPAATTWDEAAPVTYGHAESAYRAGRYGEAVDLFIRHVERAPTNPWGHYMLGLAAWKGGYLELAEAHLVESLMIDPDHLKGRINLARVLIDLGQGAAAAEHAALAESLDPESVAAKRTLARSLAAAGDHHEALAKYDEALWLDPEDTWSLNNMGYLLIQRGEAAEAVGPLALAVHLDSANATFRNNLGSALEGAGYRVAALEAYGAAAALDPGHARAEMSAGRLRAFVDEGAVSEVDTDAIAQRFLSDLAVCGGEPADSAAHREPPDVD